MIYVLVGIKNNKGTRMTRIGRISGNRKKNYTEFHRGGTEVHGVFLSVVLCVTSVFLCVRTLSLLL